MALYKNRLLTRLVYRLFVSKPRFRKFLTDLAVPDEDMDISIADASLRINRRKEIGYYRASKAAKSNIVFRDELAPLINLALLLERGDTFVDVGANVGLYSGVL